MVGTVDMGFVVVTAEVGLCALIESFVKGVAEVVIVAPSG